MKSMIKMLIVTILCMVEAVAAQQERDVSVTAIVNAKIFDGKHKELIEHKAVLVRGNKISGIVNKKDIPAGAKKIDAQGNTLIPGLIDVHTHLMVGGNLETMIYKDEQTYVGAVAAEQARRMLLRGFTSVRDAGGPAGGLKRAIDEGVIPGPRIYPSGAFISQTGGHGDFNTAMSHLSPYFTGVLDKADIFGWVKFADGVPEVQKAAREVLRSGATQLKVMASGSVTGAHDPIDVTEYTLEELKAIVTEAEHWGTYVMVHAYSDDAVRNAIEAGVKSIEHGQLVSEETLKMMKKKGVWLSLQTLTSSKTAEEVGLKGTVSEPKFNAVKKGAERAFKLAKKYGLKIAWGTDTFGTLEFQAAQSEEFVSRSKYFSPYEIMMQVTSLNAELVGLSGKRNPYQAGALGVIQKDAYADLLIVKGNPLEDITLLAHPQQNLRLIMKDGKIYKNSL